MFLGPDGTELELSFDWEHPLAQALEEPLYDEYGSFAGDFRVHGDLTWSVPERTVVLSCCEGYTSWDSIEKEV